MGWSPYRKTGLTHHQAGASTKGYTLITPEGDSSFLIDMSGRVVHQWAFTAFRPGYGRLLDNGNLLLRALDASIPQRPAPANRYAERLNFEQHIRLLGANASHLIEVDWDGNIVWEYENPAIHHDFVRLANGNTLVPEWVPLSEDFASEVKGGFDLGPNAPELLSDDIIEVDPKGREVRRISLSKLLDPVADPICPLEPRVEWTHVNGLAVTPEGHIAFSCRENSRVGIIDVSGDKLLWKFGAPQTSHQHHPTVLENGNVQIFDNGTHAPGWPRSRVIEVNPQTSEIAWQYVANPPFSFFSSHISSAERQPGGNVLICEGASGRIFEVTPSGELVWEWINPIVTRLHGQLMTRVFRAHRYSPGHPALRDRELDARKYRALNEMYGLNTGPE